MPIVVRAVASLRTALVAGAIAWAAMPAPAADDTSAKALTPIGDAIESCADGSTTRFDATTRLALLDPADTEAMSAAIVARYPQIAQDGFTPQALALWLRPNGGWVYLALLANPEKDGALCFTASFEAARFAATAALMKKYFGVET